jgi:hypothetical protein
MRLDFDEEDQHISVSDLPSPAYLQSSVKKKEQITITT